LLTDFQQPNQGSVFVSINGSPNTTIVFFDLRNYEVRTVAQYREFSVCFFVEPQPKTNNSKSPKSPFGDFGCFKFEGFGDVKQYLSRDKGRNPSRPNNGRYVAVLQSEYHRLNNLTDKTKTTIKTEQPLFP